MAENPGERAEVDQLERQIEELSAHLLLYRSGIRTDGAAPGWIAQRIYSS
jgi:hypothetical protein